MCLNLRGSYFKSIKEVEELSDYFNWNEEKIIKYGFNKKLLNNARDLKEMGI